MHHVLRRLMRELCVGEVELHARPQIRQPEWIAAMPPVRLRYADAAEARGTDHGGERLLRGELADALDQVAVGLGGAGRQLAQPRDDLEGVEVVEAVEQRHLAGRELQAQEAPTGPRDAIGLGQRPVDVRDVADAEGDGIGVERLVGERQGLGVADGEGDAPAQPRVGQALAAHLHHRRIDVAQHGAAAGPAGLEDAARDIAGAAGDVDQVEAARRPGRREPGDEVVLPQPVQAARHQVVHQVVAPGDGGEHVVDEALARAVGDLAEAEAGGVAAGGWLVAGVGLAHGSPGYRVRLEAASARERQRRRAA